MNLREGIWRRANNDSINGDKPGFFIGRNGVMVIDFKQATIEDAELLVNIYIASFYSDYIRFGECPEYGKTIEMMEESIRKYPKHIILCDN